MDEVSDQRSSAWSAWGKNLWRRVIDFLVPPKCLVCREPVLEPASLCHACWSNLKHIDAPFCNVLGVPFAYDQGEGAVSPAALAEPPQWDRARAAVAYDEASRRIVHALKYRDTLEAGLLMGRLMARGGYQPPVPMFKSMRAEGASADVPIAQGEQVIAIDVNFTWEIK